MPMTGLDRGESIEFWKLSAAKGVEAAVMLTVTPAARKAIVAPFGGLISSASRPRGVRRVARLATKCSSAKVGFADEYQRCLQGCHGVRLGVA